MTCIMLYYFIDFIQLLKYTEEDGEFEYITRMIKNRLKL